MLRSKIQIASLTAVVLFALLVICPSISFLRTDAQEPTEPVSKRLERWTSGPGTQGKDAKLKELQTERLAAARDCARMTKERVKNNVGLIEEMIEPTRTLLDAELDVCESKKERIVVLEKILAEAKWTEGFADRHAKTGQGRQGVALLAKADRLRIEIALERTKAGGDVPQKVGPAKNGDSRPASAYVGSVEAFESVRVFAQMSGFLKTLKVDIGDRVKRGDVLAVLDVPELEAQVRLDRATVDQARSRVAQAKARLSGAEADMEAAKLTVVQHEANAKGAAAQVKFRTSQLQRMQTLFDAKSIEERVLDESKERHVAAVESENAAKAAVAMGKGHVTASMSKVEQAKADLLNADAGVKVAQASLEKSEVLFSFATITAPFDGIITQRGYFAGELLRATSNTPLVTVQRVDKLRIVVAVPERDVPDIEPGNPVEIEIGALPGKKWSAKVSRMAHAEDPKTRTMQIEIDLANPTGQVRPGMFARVTMGQIK